MNLHDIQKAVRASKDKRNDFGGYAYRNAEGILAELKSVLPDGWSVLGSDRIELVGDHLFLIHAVQICDGEKLIAGAEGCAMHPTQKKGMDAAQITGSCSTYAKKYALQNLLAIDDGSVDPDATNKHDKQEEQEFDALAEAKRIKDRLNKCKTVQQLGKAWKAEVGAIQAVAGADKALGAQITNLKDMLKEHLSDDPAMQAPEDE